MTVWLLPAAAAAAWVGALLGPRATAIAPWGIWAAVAIGLLALAWGLAADRSPDPLGGRPPARRAGRGVAVAAALLAAVLGVGAARGALAEHRRATSPLLGMAPAQVDARVVLVTDPRPGAYGWRALATIVRVSSPAGTIALREPVWLGGDGDLPTATRGDVLTVEGLVRPPDDADFAGFLASRGIAVTLSVDRVVRAGGAPNPVVRAMQHVRAAVGSGIRRLFEPREAGLLLGLALGDDTRLDPGVDRDFRAAGLGHLLVVSGGNVAMVLAPIVALGGAVRLGPRARFGVALGTVVGFVILTGAEPSVLRAGVMAGITLFGILLGRPRTAAATLAASVLALLLLDPWLAAAVGFQLSAVAAAGMVAMANPIADRLPRFVPRPLAAATGATLAAQLAVMPLLLFHFREVPMVAILANVVAFPLVSPALLGGLAATGLGWVWLPAGQAVAWLASLPMKVLEEVADRSAKAPVGHLAVGGGWPVLVAGTAIVLALAWWLRSGRSPPRSAAIGAVVLLPVVVWTAAFGAGPPDALTVRFFDVGQGDAALVTSPGGVTMLIDGGPEDELVATELAALGIRRLDVVVASHPHADHVVGLPTVLARYPVGVLLQPGCPDTSADGAALDRAIADEAVPVRTPWAGDTLRVGDLRIDVLSPDRCWSGTESDTNNDALVLRVSLGDDVVLFATEPEEPAQERLLESGVDLGADVLKVPHHGGATSVPEFFDAVAPAVAVVPVGENTYGHPVPSTLAAIRASGASIFRTDRHGTVTVTFTDRGVAVDSGT